jgi:nicotinamide-nucleotide amidase
MDLAARLLATARARKAMIATAESCTGGMVSAAITDVAGSSDIFDRGFVTYSNDAKQAMLGVRAETLAAHGAVSEAVAREMAEGALARSAATLAVAVTGIAGPGGSEHKPEGRVCFGLAARGAATRAETVEFGPIGRERVRRATVDHALGLLLAALGAQATNSDSPPESS